MADENKKDAHQIAACFDETIRTNAEQVIAKYQPQYEAVIEKYRPRLEGKRVVLYVGGLRPRHVVGAYEDLGMEVVGTGYEFAHNDDYDRTIKVGKRRASSLATVGSPKGRTGAPMHD